MSKHDGKEKTPVSLAQVKATWPARRFFRIALPTQVSLRPGDVVKNVSQHSEEMDFTITKRQTARLIGYEAVNHVLVLNLPEIFSDVHAILPEAKVNLGTALRVLPKFLKH